MRECIRTSHPPNGAFELLLQIPYNNYECLTTALRFGIYHIVQSILNHVNKEDLPSNLLKSLYVQAVKGGDAKVVALLFRSLKIDKEPLLYEAARHGKLDIVKYIFEISRFWK